MSVSDAIAALLQNTIPGYPELKKELWDAAKTSYEEGLSRELEELMDRLFPLEAGTAKKRPVS